MKILFVSLNYAPELTGIGVYNTDFAEYLVEKGHKVTVFCTFPYYPAWRKDPKDRWRLFASERVGRVNVQRCFTYVPLRPSSARRVLHEAVFSFFGLFRLLFGTRPDLIIAVSPPFLGMFVAGLAARIRRIPLHVHVQDLQPDAAIDLGMLKGRLLKRVLYTMERYAYRCAAIVSCIGEAMLSRVRAKGVAEKKLLLFRNWVNMGWDDPPGESTFRQQHGLIGKFVILHAGNMGEKQALDVLLESAAIAQRAGDDMQFLLVGDGAQRSSLQRKALEEGLKNVVFLGVQTRENFADIMLAADVSVLLQRASVKDIVVPSKLLNILASGSPVVASVHKESETASILKQLSIDGLVPPEDARSLYNRLCELRSTPTLLEKLRREERELARQLFDRSNVLSSAVARIESVVIRYAVKS